MGFLAQKQDSRGGVEEVALTLDGISDSQLGSPEFIVSLIAFFKELLKIFGDSRAYEEQRTRRHTNDPYGLALRASINQQVDALTPDQRQAFLSMHNIHDDDATSRCLGIIRTNALAFGDRVMEAGIFVDACRINHACDNNAQKSWNGSIERHTVHSLRDIETGEEITIYYLGVLNSRKARQDALQRKFAFTCSCRLCSLPPDQRHESDRRLDEILKLDGLIGRDGTMGILSTPLLILRYVDQHIRLYNEQGPNDTGLPRAFIDAAQIAIIHGDLARARIFVERAVLGWTVLEGDDSSQVLQYRAFHPRPLEARVIRVIRECNEVEDCRR